MVVSLHYAQAIGLERLRALMGEVFGLQISEGGLNNILARARTPLTAAAEPIQAAVTTSRVVCCDETSVRVAGKTWWEWVFVTKAGVLHLIRPSRGKVVPKEVFGSVRPGVWVSDALGSQRGHADDWQMCLAHLLRDAQFAIDCGDRAFSAPLWLLLLRAIAIGRRRAGLQHHAGAVSRRPDPQAGPDHDGRAAGPRRRAAATAPRTRPRPPVRLRHRPRHTGPQQHVEAAFAAKRDLPKGHQRLPSRVGCRNLRSLPLGRQHRKAGRRYRPRRPQGRDGHPRRPTGVSCYSRIYCAIKFDSECNV